MSCKTVVVGIHLFVYEVRQTVEVGRQLKCIYRKGCLYNWVGKSKRACGSLLYKKLLCHMYPERYKVKCTCCLCTPLFVNNGSFLCSVFELVG